MMNIKQKIYESNRLKLIESVRTSETCYGLRISVHNLSKMPGTSIIYDFPITLERMMDEELKNII
jgi:hypothetical protein